MTAQTLKKSLLNYAICGKLSQKWRNSRISENSNSEFSENLFLENSKDFEPPFKIPNSWSWVKLGDICFASGSNLTLKDLLLNGEFQVFGASGFAGYLNTYAKEKSCIAMIKDGAGVGKIHILPPKSSVLATLQYIENNDNVTLEYLSRILVWLDLSKTKSGTTIPHIYFKNYKEFYIPLPPKDEQEFIVNELEKLMKLVDIYEVEFQKLEQSKKELKSLEKSLLNYAICGKLSTNWRNSGISENSNPKFSENSKDFEPPFEIPNTWQWAKLGDICEINLGKTPPTNENSFWGNDYPWVSIADLQDKQTITKTAKSISQKSFNEIFSKKIVKKGTLLLSFKLTIGRTSILGFDGFHNEAIASIIPKDENLISQNFLLNFLEIFVTFGEKTTAIKGATLNKEKLKNLYIPLPPKDEQEFIVNELDELFAILDEI